jgi:hypothetical protein
MHLLWQNSELFYGAEIGLFRLGSPSPIIQEYAITALEKNARAEQLWVGPRATETFEMPLWELDAVGTVKPHTQAETRLNGRDEARFEDIPPERNTDRGWFGQLSAQYKMGSLELRALLEGITPQFLAIGGESRQEAQRLTLSAQWPITPALSLSGDHVMSFAGGWRTLVITDTVRALWQPWADGPKINSAVALELTDRDLQDRTKGFDTTKITLNLKGDHKVSLIGLVPLAQELTVSATYDGVATLAQLGRSLLDSRWGITLGVTMTPSLKLRGSVALGDRIALGGPSLPGDSELSYSLGGDWQNNFMTTSYTQTARLRAGRGSFDENASVNLRFGDMTLAGVKLSPTLALSGRRTTVLGSTLPSGTLTLTAEGRTSFLYGALSGSLWTRHTLSSDERTSRQSLKQEFTGSGELGAQPAACAARRSGIGAGHPDPSHLGGQTDAPAARAPVARVDAPGPLEDQRRSLLADDHRRARAQPNS